MDNIELQNRTLKTGDLVYIKQEYFNISDKYISMRGKPHQIIAFDGDDVKLNIGVGFFRIDKKFLTKTITGEIVVRETRPSQVIDGTTCYAIYDITGSEIRYIRHSLIRKCLTTLNSPNNQLSENIKENIKIFIERSFGKAGSQTISKRKEALKKLLMDRPIYNLIWSASFNDTTCNPYTPRFNNKTGKPIPLGGGRKKKTKKPSKTKPSKKKPSKIKTKKSPKLHTGPRGGKYIIKKGKKIYQ